VRASILIPTLNRLAFLREALESARRQTKPAHEILVSDDGSTDGTREYVTEIAKENPRVKLLGSNPSPGIFTNINFLIAHCSGDAFCILGDDDRLDPLYLERLSEPLDADPGVVASFCDHRLIDADGGLANDATDRNSEIWGRTTLAGGIVDDPLAIALKQSLCIGFALFRSAPLQDETFDIQCGGAADIDYTIRVVRLGKLYFVPSRLGDYRQHPGTATQTKARYMREGFIHALEKHHFGEPHEQLRRRSLRANLLSHALLVAALDGRAAFVSLARFVRLGGWPLAPRALAAATLALAPRTLVGPLNSILRAAAGSRRK
jgi:glycosyltransferase involved in cell wall biosynthesis